MKQRKEALLILKQELRNRVTKIDTDLHNRPPSRKSSEQVFEGQNDDVLLNLKNEALHEIAQIDLALKKIANQVYGTCEKCHGDISPERLDAIPFATHCKKCVE